MTLIGTRIPSNHRAEANATLNITGYIPAALLPVGTGYLIQFLPFGAAIVTFAAAVMAFSLAALITVRISTAEHLRPRASDEHVIRGETDATAEEALMEGARP